MMLMSDFAAWKKRVLSFYLNILKGWERNLKALALDIWWWAAFWGSLWFLGCCFLCSPKMVFDSMIPMSYVYRCQPWFCVWVNDCEIGGNRDDNPIDPQHPWVWYIIFTHMNGKLVGKYTNPMDAITNIPIRHCSSDVKVTRCHNRYLPTFLHIWVNHSDVTKPHVAAPMSTLSKSIFQNKCSNISGKSRFMLDMLRFTQRACSLHLFSSRAPGPIIYICLGAKHLWCQATFFPRSHVNNIQSLQRIWNNPISKVLLWRRRLDIP